jgi:hypothetical protein
VKSIKELKMLTKTFDEYYQELTEYCEFHEVTDMEDGLPEAGVRSFFERGLTIEQAAYEIATEGI